MTVIVARLSPDLRQTFASEILAFSFLVVSQALVNYATGAVQVVANLLSSGGFDGWGQTIAWSNRLDGINGSGQFVTQMPEIEEINGTTTLAVITNATTSQYFDLVDGTYVPRFFAQSTLVYNSSTDQYTFTDESGDQVQFAGFSGSTPAAEKGQFVSFTDPYGNTTAVTEWTSSGQIAEVQSSTTSDGVTATESWVYSYVTSGVNAGLLASVALERQTGSGPVDVVRQAVFTYYDGSQPYGNAGDLMLAVVEDASGNAIDTYYYR